MIRFGFCDIWSNKGLSKFDQSMEILIIMDITKTSCNKHVDHIWTSCL